MIFNKEYDKTLWLIIAGEKNNRDIIVDFIKSIPVELHQMISGTLAKYWNIVDKDFDVYDIEEEYFDGEVVISNYKYYFIVDPFLNSLSVGRSVLNDRGDYVKTFEITMFASATYNRIENFGEQYLGRVSSSSYSSLNKSYDLISTLFGLMVVSSAGKYTLKKYKRVDLDMIPDDVDTKKLCNNDKHVRVRRI